MGRQGETQGQPVRYPLLPAGRLTGPAFIVFAVGLQWAGFFLPLVSEVFNGPAHAGAIFVISFLTALASIYWPDLEVRQVLIVPVVLFTVEALSIGAILLTSSLTTVLHHSTELLLFAKTDSAGAIFESVALQSIACGIIAMAVVIRKRSRAFHVRKAGRDREEQETLHAIVLAQGPRPDLSFYRFDLIQNLGARLVVIDERKMQATGLVARFENTMLLTDLGMVPGAHIDEFGAVQGILTRPEFEDPELESIVAFTFPNPGPWPDALAKAGFLPVDPGEIDLNLQVRDFVRRFGHPQWPDWHPLSDFPLFMIKIIAPTR